MHTLQPRQDSCLKGNRCREETGVWNSCWRPCIDYIKKLFGRGCNNVIRQILDEMTWINVWHPASVRFRRQGIRSTTIPSARVRTHRHLTGATTGVHSCWKDAIGYIRVLGDVRAWSGDVASESRAGWPVRTASHRRLRDHSLVSSCRQRQLRQIFAWISEWYGNSAS